MEFPKVIRDATLPQRFKAKLKQKPRHLNDIQFEKAVSLIISKNPDFMYF